jgi:hypothetical protein
MASSEVVETVLKVMVQVLAAEAQELLQIKITVVECSGNG